MRVLPPLLLLASFAWAAPVAEAQLTPVVRGRSIQSQGGRVDAGPRVGFPLQLWLKADETSTVRDTTGLVESWHDRSDKQNDVNQPSGSMQPLYRPYGMSGRPALQFDGNDFLDALSGMPTGDYTKVAVVAIEDFGAVNNIISGSFEHALFYGGTDLAQISHQTTFVTSNTPTPLIQPTILIATFDSNTGAGSLYQDGILVGTGTASSPNHDRDIQIGAFDGTNNLRGLISEIRIYDEVLDLNEINDLQAQLAAEWIDPTFPIVTFTQKPTNTGFVARDLVTDDAQLDFVGTVHTLGYDKAEIEVRRDGLPFAVVNQRLTYVGNEASFNLSTTIDAGLYDYDISVQLLIGTTPTVVEEVTDVVCGDVYIVQGQSNAVAADYFFEDTANQYQDFFVRTFGTSYLNADRHEFDKHWGVAKGEGIYEHSEVGALALKLGKNLVTDASMPVALFNGALGGSRLSDHQRNDGDPTDRETIYGRMLYRLQEAGLADAVRSIIWYQGESDGPFPVLWNFFWPFLYADFQADYTNLERIYVFQIRKGCDIPNNGLREVLRTLPDSYADITVMSTTAADNRPDGCHFEVASYAELADRLARVMRRDLYGSLDTLDIEPPNVDFAFWANPAKDQLIVKYRSAVDTLILEAGGEAAFLLDDPSVSILSASVVGNTVTLHLSASSTATMVSYTGYETTGPWLKNARDVGALTFFNLSIL